MSEKSNEKNLVSYLDEVDTVIKELKKQILSFSKSECVLAYRGEPMNYGETSLMPSLFREKYTRDDELNLLDLLCDYEIVDKGSLKNIEKAIDSQHYISISRLLDISFSILPALYFACSKDLDENGKIYIFAFPEYFSPQSNYIENFYSSLLDKNPTTTPFLGDFKVITHGYNNERMKIQSGGFILFPGHKYRKIPDCYYRVITIDKSHKSAILEELSSLFNISEASIYPEKDKRADFIKGKVKSTKINKRYDSKITVDSEVEAYFDRLVFELYVRNNDKDENATKSVIRIFRKEIEDLIYYIDNSNSNNENKNRLKKMCKDFFDFYTAQIK
ncbi:FRG domain-containing protein [Enterococcus sp. LJL99]